MNNFYRPYTGIGSRKAPDFALRLMFDVAMYLAKAGYTLRSGHAVGSDIAFENGADNVHGPKEIYVPTSIRQSWLDMAARHHPAWYRCTSDIKALHARNCPQILGADLNYPSKFLICWTNNAAVIGGTGQSLRIAIAQSVPIFNIGKYNDYQTARQELSYWLRGVM